MLNKKLLTVVLSIVIFTTLGCGQKGPLYEVAPEPDNKAENVEKPKTDN